ncbi:hypothetical protein LCGC14_2547770 [marine sediment metagenome]|uniref:Uncharacterized protein n=1 Tax=marine sediment metagenome TaxID=412755 RepID=A0A0F9BBN7_9ZZZZ
MATEITEVKLKDNVFIDLIINRTGDGSAEMIICGDSENDDGRVKMIIPIDTSRLERISNGIIGLLNEDVFYAKKRRKRIYSIFRKEFRKHQYY